MEALLAETALPWSELHRRHAVRNLGMVAESICTAFTGDGPIVLSRRRCLVVLAVDGLGYGVAAEALSADHLIPVTSEYPSTTTSSMLTSLTSWPASEHGVMGVHFLHPDGRRAVNVLTGWTDRPSSRVGRRPTGRPEPVTVFQRLSRIGVESLAVPREMLALHRFRRYLFRGASIVRSQIPPDGSRLDATVSGLAAEIRALVERTRSARRSPTLVWVYVNLDDHLHRYGPDDAVWRACRLLGTLADGLRRDGSAVLLYADHGCTPSTPGDRVMDVWHRMSGPRFCRLPPGGAGRTRWLYPHAGRGPALVARLRAELPDAVVVPRGEIADVGLLRAGSPGHRRLGEVVLLARGPDFPVPDPAMRFEHGSMTPDEILVPLAVWHGTP